MVLILVLAIPVVAGLACIVARWRWLMELLNFGAFLANFALALALLQNVLEEHVVTAWDSFLRADALSAWMVLLISVVSLSSAIYARSYFRRELAAGEVTAGRFREFYVLTPWFAAAMCLVVLADNLGVMWVALEVTAMASVLLVALYNRSTSLEAAWKYIIIGSFGLVLALFGTLLIYAAGVDKASAGVPAITSMPSFHWSQLLAIADHLDPRLVKLAFVFALIGYGTKAGLAPMHTWLPDAHSEAPSPTSAMLSGVSLKIAIYALLRFHILATHSLQGPFSRSLLLVFGLASMLLAGPFILVQTNLKRLLAYSSLEHVGLICTGLAMNAPLTIFGALLHMGYHALTKPVLFFASGNIHQQYHTLELRRIGSGVIKTMPVTGFLLALAAMAVAGLPPFGLFTSELLVIAGGFGSDQVVVSSIALGALVLVFCGVLKQMAALLLGSPKDGESQEKPAFLRVVSMALPLGALLCFSLWLPGMGHELLKQAAQIIGGQP